MHKAPLLVIKNMQMTRQDKTKPVFTRLNYIKSILAGFIANHW